MTDNNKLLHCSFCGKSQDEVAKLIAGPNVCICNECVSLCNEIMGNEEQSLPPPPAFKTPQANSPAPQFSFRDLPLAMALHQAGRISLEVAEALKQQAMAEYRPVVELLIKNGHFNDQSLAAFCSEAFGLPMLDLAKYSAEPVAAPYLDGEWLRLNCALPVAKSGNQVFVAIADPTNTAALDHIQTHTGLSAEPVVVEHAALARFIERRNRSF